MVNPLLLSQGLIGSNLPNIAQYGLDANANQGEEAYYAILRKMAQMPDAQLPEPAGMQFDPKGMLIGSALAGLVGGGEGANAFLQGTLAGKQYNQQQENVRREQEFRKKKLQQDREYGILKTEADIANAKANRAFQRSEGLRRDTASIRAQKAIEDRQARTQGAMDLRAAEEDLGNARTPIAFDLALARFQRAGGKADPAQIAQQREMLVQAEKEAKDAKAREEKRKQFQPTFNRYVGAMLGNGKPGDKAFAAQMVRSMMTENPEYAGASGVAPAQIESMFSEHAKGVQVLTRIQQLEERAKQLTVDTKDFDLKFKKKIEKDELLKVEAARKKAVADANTAIEDAKNPQAAARRKMLTDTGYLSAFGTAKNRYVEALGKFTEADNYRKVWEARAKARAKDPNFKPSKEYPTQKDWVQEALDAAESYQAQADALKMVRDEAKSAMGDVEKFARESWGQQPPQAAPTVPYDSNNAQQRAALFGAIGGGNKPLQVKPGSTTKLSSGATVKIG